MPGPLGPFGNKMFRLRFFNAFRPQAEEQPPTEELREAVDPVLTKIRLDAVNTLDKGKKLQLRRMAWELVEGCRASSLTPTEVCDLLGIPLLNERVALKDQSNEVIESAVDCFTGFHNVASEVLAVVRNPIKVGDVLRWGPVKENLQWHGNYVHAEHDPDSDSPAVSAWKAAGMHPLLLQDEFVIDREVPLPEMVREIERPLRRLSFDPHLN